MPIDRIEIHVTQLPGRLQRTFSSGSYDTGPPEQLLGKPVLVKIHADGVVGVAQVRPISPGHFVADTVHSVVAAIRDIYGPLLIGRRLADFEANDVLMSSRLAGNPAARAVLDIALHDALGKSLGVPVHDLLGGRSHDVIPLEWSVSLYDDVERIIDDARRAVDEFGIRVLCLKAAGKGGWRKDVSNFAAVRKAIGPDVMIGVDPNTGWTVADSILALDAMHDMDVGYCEQPVERRNLRGLAAIRAQARGVPMMADESLFTVQDAAELAHSGAVDVFCIKLYKVGGLTVAKRMLAIADAFDIGINCGGLAVASQFEAAAAAHFCAAVPGKRTFGAAEFVFGAGVMGPDPLVAEGGFTIVDGAVSVPTAPGLGLTLDEDALKRMTLLHVDVGT
ncbi:enolase C-terminal domain-like protein [Sphingomonas sp. ZT3P38]|uniref:mandelate racemase/muconate lactonizing enzyme family protein n=1 Tax=Parasphingomonas zepuensis TaxID=3096161 RepID=UPI002FC9EA3A